MNVAKTYETHEERFYAWIFERQHMWYKRHAVGIPAPWTDDPVLGGTKFTNAYHELDRGTVYLHDIVLIEGLSLEKALIRILAYRFFNRVSTWDTIFRGQDFFVSDSEPDWEHFERALNARRASAPLFTAAHQTSAQLHVEGETTHARTLTVIRDFWGKIDELADGVRRFTDNPMKLYKFFRTYNGLGEFLAFEILSDLACTDYVEFSPDTWAACGPGSKSGLRLIFPDRGLRSDVELMRELQNGQKQFYNSQGLPLFLLTSTLHDPFLSLRNIEHSLCEYFKYDRTLNTGTARELYRPEAGYVWKSENAAELYGYAVAIV
jgi:hypothetical protein